MKLISKSIFPKGTYTPSAIILLIAILYFIQQVNSIHMAFLTPDINIINIYPIYLQNYSSQMNVYTSDYNLTYDNANIVPKGTYTSSVTFY
jgi:hypothetical protein